MDFLLAPSNPGLHHSEGWTIPPLDGSLSVPDLYDFHYKHNPDHPIFVHANPGSSELTYVRYAELIPAAHRAGWIVTKLMNFNHDLNPKDRPSVAFLAASDTITFFTTFVGLFRAGIPFLPISPRNSPAAIAHLIQATRPTHILISEDAALHDLAKESLALLNESDRPPAVAAMPLFEDLYTNEKDFVPLPPRKRDLSATNMIVHSSGSTSFPKPIYWTDRTCGQSSMAPHHGEQNYTGKVFGAHCLAMYHAIGINFVNWISTTGLVLAVFPPTSPAIIPIFDAVWDGIVATKPAIGFGPPVFVEVWAKDPAKVKYLKETETNLLYGGGPLNKTIGDMLASEGIQLFSMFGITEAGVLCKHLPESTDMDWEYLQMNPSLAVDFDPQDDGTYEMIVISKPYTEIHVINTKWKGEDAYATNDLFVPHPTLPGRWKLVGRKDDQIMLSTGEKTNPTPLEQILSQDPWVTAGLMFGRGRFQNGLLVQLKPEYQFDPSNEELVIKYRSLIWPTIEKMNEFAPSHSRLFKELIIFANPSKPFSFNAKGAPRRKVILAEYDQEINALYDSIEKRRDGTHPNVWTYESSLEFVRKVVNENITHPAKDDDADIFDCGCDSLQAAWIRNTIAQALRDTQPAKARAISTSFVYDHPRITWLAKAIAEDSPSNGSIVQDVDPISAMESTLARLASPDSFSALVASRPVSELSSSLHGDVVLVTGTTGGLGAALLAKLVESESVQKVYALNRPTKGSQGLLERQKEALESRGYPPSIASSPKVVLVEADITGEGLGVDASLDREIRSTVTHIIHNAWKVDFNQSLASFESNLKGMRTLIDLALTSPQRTPPRIVFTSSVGVLRNTSAGTVVPEAPLDDPSTAVGQGYSESKWVGEQMLYAASRETNLRPVIARIGQIAGGPNGAWNSSDWVPAIVKSSIALKCLPAFKGTCTWVPMDVVADTVVDLRNANDDVNTVHIVHPKAQPSTDIFQVLGEELSLPLVPYPEWLDKLEKEPVTKETMEAVPALKLLDFFRAGRNETEGFEALGIPAMSCERAKAAAPHLRNATAIKPAEVVSWIQGWTEKGFLPLTK